MKKLLFLVSIILAQAGIAQATHNSRLNASNLNSGTIPTARYGPEVFLTDSSTQSKTGGMTVEKVGVGGSTVTHGAFMSVGFGSMTAPGGPATLVIRKAAGTGGLPVLQFDGGISDAPTIQGRAGAGLDICVGAGVVAGGDSGNECKMTIKEISPEVLITGDLTITGAISKGSGSFQIPHPTKSGQWLIHGFVESDKYGVTYDGEAQLSGGVAVINLPSYVETVLAVDGRTLQITPVDGWSPLYRDGPIENGKFTVRTAAGGSNTQKFNWQLSGKRGDPFVKGMKNGQVDVNGNLIIERDIKASELNYSDEPTQGLSLSEVRDNAVKRLRSQYSGFEGEGKDLPKLKQK